MGSFAVINLFFEILSYWILY